MGILSTREWATVIWAFIFFVYAMVHRQIREAFWKVVKIFFGKKLRILWGIILLYVLGITLIFYHLPFWDNVYIKDIIVWFLFSGLIYCMNAVSQEADEEFIRKVLKDNLKLTAILEFIISTFTFNIWVELAIIPITTMIVMMNVIAARNILELYSKYELLFVRMSFKEEKDKKIQRRHRWLVIKVCKLSVHKVLLFQKKYWYKMYSKMSVEGFEKLIEEFRNECNNER